MIDGSCNRRPVTTSRGIYWMGTGNFLPGSSRLVEFSQENVMMAVFEVPETDH